MRPRRIGARGDRDADFPSCCIDHANNGAIATSFNGEPASVRTKGKLKPNNDRRLVGSQRRKWDRMVALRTRGSQVQTSPNSLTPISSRPSAQEGQCRAWSRGTLQHVTLNPFCGSPDPNGSIVRAGGDQFAIGAERDRQEFRARADPTCRFRCICYIPDNDLIGADGGDAARRPGYRLARFHQAIRLEGP